MNSNTTFILKRYPSLDIFIFTTAIYDLLYVKAKNTTKQYMQRNVCLLIISTVIIPHDSIAILYELNHKKGKKYTRIASIIYKVFIALEQMSKQNIQYL